jgi:hypothetical protein
MLEQLELFPKEETQTQGSVEIPKQEQIKDAEWCFQFFNNKPVVFGWQSENAEPAPLVLQIQPVEGDVVTFKHNGMEFRIFAKPISEETKQIRKEQDANQNKEAQS